MAGWRDGPAGRTWGSHGCDVAGTSKRRPRDVESKELGAQMRRERGMAEAMEERRGGRERKRKSGIVAAVLKEQEASASAKGHVELSTNRINDSSASVDASVTEGEASGGLGAPHMHEPRLVSVRYSLIGRGEGRRFLACCNSPRKLDVVKDAEAAHIEAPEYLGSSTLDRYLCRLSHDGCRHAFRCGFSMGSESPVSDTVFPMFMSPAFSTAG
jgi:hypothetical protein